jgi:branched-chain amino acid transport system substrate-binding protein
MLSEGAGVTVPCHDLDTVVTEYGVAELRGKCVKDRMQALIGIAHPDFRDWIRDEAARLGIVPRVVVPGFTPARPPIAATAPGVTADTIRLGTFCDLSGPNAGIGLAAWRGYSTYYEQVNRFGGVHGRMIELIVEDDGFDPTRTKLAVLKLLHQDKVFAIVSPLGTPTNLAVMDYMLEKEVPVISPHSGLSVWSNPLKRTYFALQPSYRVEGRILAQYGSSEIKPKRVAILAVDDEYGREEAAAFTAELARAGIEPVLSLGASLREGGAAAWVRQLQAAQPDLVLLSTYVKPAADVLRASHELGFHPTWLGGYVLSGPDLIRLAGAEATEGLLCASYATGPRSHRGERLFQLLMSRRYGEHNPGTHSRIGYAAAQLVVEGLKRAGQDLTREGFIRALESIQTWTGGLVPPISYSADDHRGLTALSMLRAKSGLWIVVRDLLELKD